LTLHPLIVDLDGTLIHTDMLHETVLRTLRDNPLGIFRIPLWLSRGKAVLKRNLAGQTDVDAAHLPYNDDLINWLRRERAQGRKLILCTASDRLIAETVSSHLGIFDEVMASDGVTNLSGIQKAKALEQRFGKSGFDYAGNSSADLTVWKCSRNGVVVNASRSVARQAKDICHVEQIFPPKQIKLTTWRKALRIHQWMKNLLLFIPLLAAHQITNFAALQSLLLAFVSFSLCASAVYLSNDLLDLESDRQHPRKRNRPFASGALPVWVGVALTPLLLVASATLATYVGGTFFRWLLLYFVLTCAYSFGIKRIILMDCLVLAMLYTIRIVAGAAAAKLSLSFWLLAFAVFLFLSLAYVKRYAELELQLAHGKTKVLGRGYYTSDAPLVQTLGISAGYASVVVLALYLNSEAVTKLYRTPEVVWAAVPILAFWVSWMWMQAHRGNMHDDPLVFAIKDVASLLAGVAFAIVLAIGAAF
jgi:4-hydroxybenzoate polyprenyltransferase/phosphoserine phosphatase